MIISVLQPLDEFVRKDKLCRGNTFLVRGIPLAVADIVHNRALEYKRVLHQYAHLPAQGEQAGIPYVGAVDGHASLPHVVEPGQHIDNGGLSGSGRPHKSDRFPGAYMEVEVLQNVYVFLVSEGHIVKVDLSPDVFQNDGVVLILDIKGIVDGVKHLLQVGADLGELLDNGGDLGQGVLEGAHVGGEGYHHSRGNQIVSRKDQRQSHAVDAERAEVPEDLYNGMVEPAALCDVPPHINAVLVNLLVNALVYLDPVVILYDLLTHDGFHKKRRPVGVFKTMGRVHLAEVGAEEEYYDHHGNDGDKYDQRKRRAQGEHKYRHYHQLYYIDGKHHDVIGKEVRQSVNILCHADYDLAVRPVVEIVEGEFLQPVKNIRSYLRYNFQPHFAHAPALNKRGYNFHGGEKYQPCAHKSKLSVILVFHHLVNHEL